MPDGQVRNLTLTMWGNENNVSSTFAMCHVDYNDNPAVRKLLRDCMIARILIGFPIYSRGSGDVSVCCLALQCPLTSSASPAAACLQSTACWCM